MPTGSVARDQNSSVTPEVMREVAVVPSEIDSSFILIFEQMRS